LSKAIINLIVISLSFGSDVATRISKATSVCSGILIVHFSSNNIQFLDKYQTKRNDHILLLPSTNE